MKRRTIYRKKRNGKFYGNWLISIDGKEVNLGTKSATIATGLVPEAEGGRRNFDTDAQAAAAAIDQVAGGGGAAAGTETQSQAGGQTPSLPAAPPPPPAAPAAPAAAPAAPAETPEQSARAEAAATNDAAAQTADTSSPAPANDNGAPALPPEVLDGFLRSAAGVMVDVQLQLQAYGIKRATGKIAGEIPDSAAVRGLAAEAWAAQFKIWFPAETMLPPWAMALVLTAMCAPVQLATATAPPPKDPDIPAENTEKAAA